MIASRPSSLTSCDDCEAAADSAAEQQRPPFLACVSPQCQLPGAQAVLSLCFDKQMASIQSQHVHNTQPWQRVDSSPQAGGLGAGACRHTRAPAERRSGRSQRWPCASSQASFSQVTMTSPKAASTSGLPESFAATLQRSQPQLILCASVAVSAKA